MAMKGLCRYSVLLFVSISVSGQIVFPENNVDSSIKNRFDREPYFAPSRCPENELFYPGDHASDWICDCRPAYLYHPLSKKCHPAYRRGPCLVHQYLVLPAKSQVPICVTNPCQTDGMVPWAAGCALLDSVEACTTPESTRVPGHAQRLAINVTALVLECQPLVLRTRLGEVEKALPACLPGCRRSVVSACGNEI